MKKSEIHFDVVLDNDSVPEKIHWHATDNPNEGIDETRAVSIAIWDMYHKGTMKVDLWTKEMPVQDMKQFCIDIIGTLSDTMLRATGDEKMSDAMNDLCHYLTELLKKEAEEQGQ
ncbi:gliding motility protein GldC [Cytophagaceae bacterium DM2B3-1]|uniref:Gliding motility protein GldC n=2 Tax=Xanthocytophaga TaxID=3078918 RepID=A0AAE3UAF8_9BACT|nr:MULTISPECIES: gliding motility protein GldC [Xanthocytophaga]MDJ1469854.1 gliding motility protein GldC [Xanthocytophaga flavus]MDJ1483258.1 gliding motility protein GldC [Xanthocytophaga flavus]MDJ1494367.1 gliding motility protein GldC [Xanthocytophaga flavus]MDJ1503220.1 gliding motility protein GldC [Xanthocytophaga agilis]